jgi:N-methylhydantoinase B
MTTSPEVTVDEPGSVAPVAPAPAVPMYEAPDREIVDAITFEIISHKFVQLTAELATTLQRTSGSVVVTEAMDFNVSLADETGEIFAVGDYGITHGAALQHAIRWTLENRAENPGIEPGDMFLLSDPWVGVVHQPDVGLLAPIFIDGCLFAWAACTMHMLDTGGAFPGGLNTAAVDVFSEPAPIPPIRLVRGFALQDDVEEMFVRRSRLRKLLSLDLRAMIASNRVAIARLTELAESYSASVVHRVIKQELDNAETEFRARLRELPDGRWSDVQLCEVSGDGDRNVYAVRGTMEKHGDDLLFDFSATDEQAGFFNSTWPSAEGGIVAAVLPLLCPDLTWAPGGVLRAIRFAYTLGTIVAAEFPAAVSAGPISGGLFGANVATMLISKMLSSASPEQKRNLLAVTTACIPINIFRGLSDDGHPILVLNIECVPGGTGARSWRDGDHYAAVMLSPVSRIPNVEHQEHHYPLLWLYRRELRDSAGAGAFRGGVAGESAVIPYGVSQPLEMMLGAHGVAMPSSRGINGGLPAKSLGFRVFRDVDLQSRFAEGRMPVDVEQLGSDIDWPHPKSSTVRLGPRDVFASSGAGGGGYGDPLEREPELVAHDVTEGYVSTELAAGLYGVVFAGEEVDREATQELRAKMRGSRLGHGPLQAPGGMIEIDGGRHLSESVILTPDGDAVCGRCGAPLAQDSQDFRRGTTITEFDMQTLGLVWIDPATYIDDELILRGFCCPQCGTLLDTELARPSDPVDLDRCLA